MRRAAHVWGLTVLTCGLASLCAIGLIGAARAGASDSTFAIQTASLHQDGQDLVWRTTLDRPFTAAALKRSGRSLCLVLQAPRLSPRQLCLSVGRDGAIVRRWLHGAGRTIDATISRPASDEISIAFKPAALRLSYRPLHWQVLSVQDGQQVAFPATPAALALHVPRLVGCVPRGSSLVYSGPSTRREVALTFDDGPWNQPPTIDFLKTLERLHAPATFFEIGSQLATFDPSGALERRMLADGDMIGDHTWSHPQMPALSQSSRRSQLERTLKAIRTRTGFTPCLWRPPYGARDRSLDRLARSEGMLTINWDVDTRDWATPGTSAIVQTVLGNAHPGAIVIQHFGGGPRYQTLAALPREIKGLRARGYRLVTVTQLLGLRLIYK